MRRREVSPEFWTDERVVAVSDAAKLLFVGVLHIADREGRLLDRPMAISMKVRPWDAASGPAAFEELVAIGLIARYQVGSERYAWVPRFAKWQRPHPREQPSVIPPPSDEGHTREAMQGPSGSTLEAMQGPSGSTKDRPWSIQGQTMEAIHEQISTKNRAGSSGSSGSSGPLGTSQDLSGPSGSSGPSGPSPVQHRLDGGEDEPTGRKASVWEKLWEEKLSLDRLVQIAKNDLTTVDDPTFDTEEHELDLKPQLINTLLKKVAVDLERKFAAPEAPWTLQDRLEAVETAWAGYLEGSFGASVDPPYALNAFASPKTSLPSYERAKAEE